jgi:hypothetical protein
MDPTVSTEDLARKAKEAMREKIRLQLAQTKSSGGETITSGDLDAAASILNMVGAGSIAVVPSGVDMQAGNSAICIKSGTQATAFKMKLAKLKDAYPEELYETVRDMIAVDTILVKKYVIDEPDTKRCGIIWHEYGHIAHGAAENGNVFAQEIASIESNFSAEAAKSYVAEVRGGIDYFVSYANDPGLDNLYDVMDRIGYPEFRERKTGKIAQAQEHKRSKWQTGMSLRGTIAELRNNTGATDDPPETFVDYQPFEWGACRWQRQPMEREVVDKGQLVYDIKVLERLDV